MNQLKIFIQLTRIDKPIGYMLLFWPCGWGLAYAFIYDQNLDKFLYFLFLFLSGSILMRSAGCIFNDIVDRDIDKKVRRTKKRPIASGKISVIRSMLYVIILCSVSLLILIQFNKLTIFLGLASMLLAFSYPFMKRITYWPQLFLGLTFNWGLVMAWVSVTNVISADILILYISAIFWTLGYDTIYGTQDIIDDEIIGNKSTAIKFKDNLKPFVSICYLISSVLLIYLFTASLKLNYSMIFVILFIVSLAYQIKMFKKNKPKNCLKAFKLNNLSGLILFTALVFQSI
jgi:4-hydroxybenzoate polyprenyltransferase